MRLHKDLFVTAGAGYGICETQQTVYTKDGDVMFAAMVGSPVNTFDDVRHSYHWIQRSCVQESLRFSPTGAPLLTCSKRISTSLEHGCRQQKKN